MNAAIMTRVLAGVWVFWLVFFPGSIVSGQTTPEKKQDQEIPLHITALHLEADQTERLITFSGQVKAQHGESTLYSERLKVYYKAPDSKATPAAEKPPEPSPLADLGGEKIDRIEAEGQVRYVQADKVAAGQKAIYYRDEDKVVLLGNPQVWRGENNLKGERIILYLKDNRVVVESSPQQRVEAHLYQAPGAAPKVGGLLPGATVSPKKAGPKKKKDRKL